MDDSDHDDDAQLLHAIASGLVGARDAEASLCRRYGRRAQLYGRKHLHDAARAVDLAQSVMLAVLEAARAGRIEDPLRLDRFVLGTCRNIAQRMREVDARAQPTEQAALESFAAVPPTPTLERADVGALFRCLRALDPRGRMVIHLSFNEELSSEKIAVMVETTAGNVRVLRHRALAQLRRCLDDHKKVVP
jgi:RNA polymerase sigma-70 factor (ECF subfamily)